MDRHTVVTYQSWGQRLHGACTGVCIGLILFIGSFPLLVWNEGRSIQRYESLEEGRKNVVRIPDASASIDSSREGKLVYLSGKAVVGTYGTGVSDPIFYSVQPANTLKLRRDVEMYQWEEHKSSHTTKTEGGGSRTETTYSYNKKWSTSLIDSDFFYDSSSHQNPSRMPYESLTLAADPITVGSYTLSSGLIDKINWWRDWVDTTGSLSVDKIADGNANFATVYGSGFYIGQNPSNPQVGDVKIGFKYIPEGTVSLVAAQTGNSFSPYMTQRGGSLLLLRSGQRSSDELFLMAERDNTIITWLVRCGGFLIMYIGLKSVAGPLEVVLDKIPCIGRFAGDLMSGATSVVACMAAGALSILTIAIAWLAFRPLLAFFLLAIVGGLVYLMRQRVDDKRRTEDYTPTVHATPDYGDYGTPPVAPVQATPYYGNQTEPTNPDYGFPSAPATPNYGIPSAPPDPAKGNNFV
jgi:hypothetical protein